jgi:hypothetical protein
MPTKTATTANAAAITTNTVDEESLGSGVAVGVVQGVAVGIADGDGAGAILVSF